LFIEKEETHKLAQQCAVPHPKGYLPKTLVELYGIKDKIKYPLILKPVIGHEFKSRFNKKNFEINDERELFEKFTLCLECGLEVICQEIIPGPDTNIYKMLTYVNSRGSMSAKFFYRKVRQNPPGFGVMRVGVSEDRNLEVERLSGEDDSFFQFQRILQHRI
jgi:predicted ATP-grasp superfamily ATP-dependent carboligase